MDGSSLIHGTIIGLIFNLRDAALSGKELRRSIVSILLIGALFVLAVILIDLAIMPMPLAQQFSVVVGISVTGIAIRCAKYALAACRNRRHRHTAQAQA